MRRLFTLGLFVALGAMAVCGQESPSAPLPPAIQSAINRILARTPIPEPIQLHNPPAAGACSAPLLEMRVAHPERFPIQTAPAPKTGDPMPSAQAPAPPCEPPPAQR